MAQRKKEDEERRAREVEEKKQREADEKRMRLEEAEKKRQAMIQAQKDKDKKGPNFTIQKREDGAVSTKWRGGSAFLSTLQCVSIKISNLISYISNGHKQFPESYKENT